MKVDENDEDINDHDSVDIGERWELNEEREVDREDEDDNQGEDDYDDDKDNELTGDVVLEKLDAVNNGM